MAGASRLEEIDAWMKAKALVKRIYELTAVPPAKHDFAYCNQIRRASISIMSNIAEGFGRSSDKEFARFLDIARGSSFETQSLIHVARDIEYMDEEESEELIKSSFQVIAMVTSLANYLRDGRNAHLVSEDSASAYEYSDANPDDGSDIGPLTSDPDPHLTS